MLSVIKEFQARVERESEQKLKVVRTNNGGEFRGQFEQYCKSCGIKMLNTVVVISNSTRFNHLVNHVT